MTVDEIKVLVAHTFHLCMAKRSLEALATRTATIECAIFDIDEQLEQLAEAMNVTVAGIWESFNATATAADAVMAHGVHRAASIARTY